MASDLPTLGTLLSVRLPPPQRLDAPWERCDVIGQGCPRERCFCFVWHGHVLLLVARSLARCQSGFKQEKERDRRMTDTYLTCQSSGTDCRLQSADCRLQLADCGQRTSGQRTSVRTQPPPPRAVLDRDGVRSIGGCENKKEKGSASRYEGPDARVAATISSMYITIPPGFVPRSVARSLRSLL